MLVAVTGGMGFIGQEVICRLQERGHRVILVDYWRTSLSTYEARKYPILESVYRSASTVDELLEPNEFLLWMRQNSVDTVIHLGATADTTDMGSRTLIYNNVEFTRELIDAMNTGRASTDIPGIVFASSAATYGSKGFPNNPYGLTKCLGERFVSKTRGGFVSLRFFNVFGRNEHHKGKMASVPFKLAEAYRESVKFDMHSPDAARDFVPVTTVAAKVVAYAEMIFETSRECSVSQMPNYVREVADLGTGYATTFSDLDNYVMQAMKQYVSCVRHVPMPPELVGRYQPYTCAGQREVNAGLDSQSTRDAIEEIYGH